MTHSVNSITQAFNDIEAGLTKNVHFSDANVVMVSKDHYYELLSKIESLKEAPKERYIDNQDGTITDTSTELMWKQNPEEDIYTFEEVNEIKSNFVGYDDWRVPTIHELFSLVDVTRLDPAIDPIFSCKAWHFWSASAYSYYSNDAWLVGFYRGDVSRSNKSSSYAVLLVRNV